MDENPNDPELRELLGNGPGPRPHHYAFAHDYLPGILWHDPALLLFALFTANEEFREEQIHIRWGVVGERFDPAERLPDRGLCCSTHALADGHQAAVITLPPAERPTEAHMVAIVYRPPRRRLLLWRTEAILRYFTLELSFDPESGGWLSALCDWTPHGHLNYGEGPPNDVAAFLGAIHRLLNKKRAVSAAFSPGQK
jgi:hypothetical protein